MKNRKWIVLAAVVFALAAVTGGVYAYLQNTVEQPNKLVVGQDVAEVTETFPEPTYMAMQDSFTKQVAVKNTGSSDQFVRVYLDFSDSTVRDKATILYGVDNTDPAAPKPKEASWSDFLADLPEGWVYVSEVPAPPETAEQTAERETLGGYFYYTKILEPNETTPNLIEGVKTDFRLNGADMDGNPDKITDFDVIVYTESVQTVETGTGTVYADADWKNAWQSFLTRTP